MKVYAECNIVISPTIDAKSIRKRSAEVNMEIFSSQGVNAPKPITLVIKGGNLAHIWKLMEVLHKSDEELAEKARGSALSDLVKDMTDAEAATWARNSIIEELQDMEGANEDSLV